MQKFITNDNYLRIFESVDEQPKTTDIDDQSEDGSELEYHDNPYTDKLQWIMKTAEELSNKLGSNIPETIKGRILCVEEILRVIKDEAE